MAAAHLQNITKAVEVGLSLMDLRKLGRGAKESLRDESLANPLFMRRSYIHSASHYVKIIKYRNVSVSLDFLFGSK